MRLINYLGVPFHLLSPGEQLARVNQVRMDRKSVKPKTQRRKALGEKVRKYKKAEPKTSNLTEAQTLELIMKLEKLL